MKIIFISLYAATVISAATNDSQSILVEVSNLRQKYEECRRSQEGKSGNSKILEEYNKKNKSLEQELSQKNGVIKSLEQTLTARDRAYREASEKNKNLISQIHGEKVSYQEREMLKRSLVIAKNELAQLQKDLKQASQTKVVYKDRPITTEKIVEKIVYKDRPVVTEKIVTKTVESTEKLKQLQRELESAQVTIANLKSSSQKPIIKEKIVEKTVYKDRPISTQKVIEKVVYKDKPVIQEKIVEKIVYKDRPVQKVVVKETIEPKKPSKTILQAQAIAPSTKPKSSPTTHNEQKQRQIDKLALERERLLSQQNTTAKISPSVVSKEVVAPSVKTSSPTVKRSSPSAYRMATNAGIYNAINGTKIDMWESGRSFTSGTTSDGWVKITGYFVNRVWRAADEELWVKESDVIRR